MQLEHKINSLFQSDQSFGYKYDTGNLVRIRYRPSYWSGTYPKIDEYFTRDKSGIIQNVTLDNEFTVQYNDDLEITSVNHTLPSPHTETYSYDRRGNRLSSHSNTYLYNDLNQLTESATHTYSYDADGNMTRESNNTTGEIKLFYYSSDNRLLRYEHIPPGQSTPATVATYTYDTFGRRLSKTVNGSTIHFHWEGNNLAMELDASFAPIRRYTYGVGKDSVEGHIEFSEASSNLFAHPYGWYSYIKDQAGTIYKIHSQQSQRTVHTRHFDNFGNLISESGATKGNLGFQSKYFDNESSMNYYFYRYYNPTMGRFISEDPEGIINNNLYQFVLNNPVNLIDPFGLSADPLLENQTIINKICCLMLASGMLDGPGHKNFTREHAFMVSILVKDDQVKYYYDFGKSKGKSKNSTKDSFMDLGGSWKQHAYFHTHPPTNAGRNASRADKNIWDEGERQVYTIYKDSILKYFKGSGNRRVGSANKIKAWCIDNREKWKSACPARFCKKK